MSRINFDNYNFRCSSLGKLMTGDRPNLTLKQEQLLQDLQGKQSAGSITPKQTIALGELLAKKAAKPTLSDTTKKYLGQIHLEEVFDKKTEIKSKYLDKGIQVEEDSITLYSEVKNTPFYKNIERKNNDWITGLPDNVKGKIRDIKSSWDLSTFPMYESKIPNTDYFWQLQGYMELWNIEEAELIYCLVDTPEILIEDEKRRMSWKMGMIDLPDELAEEIERNMLFANVPKELRCKVFEVQRDEDAIERLYARITMCRKHLNDLSLTLADITDVKPIQKVA